MSHGVENYFPGLWGTGISDDIFVNHTKLANEYLQHERWPVWGYVDAELTLSSSL